MSQHTEDTARSGESRCEPAQPEEVCLPKEEAIPQKPPRGKHGVVQWRRLQLRTRGQHSLIGEREEGKELILMAVAHTLFGGLMLDRDEVR